MYPRKSVSKPILNNKIRWAILGTSFISITMADAIEASEDAELYAIGSRNVKTLNELADKHHIAAECRYTDLEALVNNPDVHAVYIGLPNHLHKEWIIRCAEAGKHVLCEKPLVLDAAEYDEIHAAVIKNKVICLEALMYRHHPFVRELQKLVNEDKRIGDIKSFAASYTANIAHLANPLAGGATRNLGCYPISLIRLLTDAEPISISASGVLNPATNTDHQAIITLAFSNGIAAHITTQDNDEKFYQFIINGSLGTLRCIANPWMAELTDNKLVITSLDGHEEVISVSATKPLYTYQIDLVSRGILEGNVCEINTESFKHSSGNVVVVSDVAKQVVKQQIRHVLR